MSPTPTSKTPSKSTDNKAAPKTEPTPKADTPPPVIEAAPVVTNPVAPQDEKATQVTKKGDDAGDKKPFTIMVPVKTYKLLAIIGRVEGKSISECILAAVEKDDLRGRAKRALAAIADEIDDE